MVGNFPYGNNSRVIVREFGFDHFKKTLDLRKRLHGSARDRRILAGLGLRWRTIAGPAFTCVKAVVLSLPIGHFS